MADRTLVLRQRFERLYRDLKALKREAQKVLELSRKELRHLERVEKQLRMRHRKVKR